MRHLRWDGQSRRGGQSQDPTGKPAHPTRRRRPAQAPPSRTTRRPCRVPWPRTRPRAAAVGSPPPIGGSPRTARRSGRRDPSPARSTGRPSRGPLLHGLKPAIVKQDHELAEPLTRHLTRHLAAFDRPALHGRELRVVGDPRVAGTAQRHPVRRLPLPALATVLPVMPVSRRAVATGFAAGDAEGLGGAGPHLQPGRLLRPPRISRGALRLDPTAALHAAPPNRSGTGARLPHNTSVRFHQPATPCPVPAANSVRCKSGNNSRS